MDASIAKQWMMFCWKMLLIKLKIQDESHLFADYLSYILIIYRKLFPIITGVKHGLFTG